MVKKSRLQKSYEKEGLAGLTWRQLDMLKAIETRYSHFRTFFKSLAKEYPKASGLSNQINKALAMTEDAASTIGGLRGLTKRTVRTEELEELFSSMQIVSEIAKDLSIRREASAAFSQKLAEVEAQSGITMKGISETSRNMRKEIAGMGRAREGVGAFLGKHAAPVADLAKDVTGGLATALLGPFAGVLGTMGKAATGVVGGLHRGLVARRRRKFLGGLGPAARQVSEGWLEGTLGRRTRGLTIPGILRGGALGDVPGFGNIFSGTRPSGGAGISTGVGIGPAVSTGFPEKLTKKQIVAMSLPLSYFFSKSAYKAKWTHEVVVLLRKIAKQRGDGIGGIGSAAVAGAAGGGVAGALTGGALLLVKGLGWVALTTLLMVGLKKLLEGIRPRSIGEKLVEDTTRFKKIKKEGLGLSPATERSLEWRRAPTFLGKGKTFAQNLGKAALTVLRAPRPMVQTSAEEPPQEVIERKVLETIPMMATQATGFALVHPALERLQKATFAMTAAIKDLRPKEAAISKPLTSEYYREKDRILDRVNGSGLVLDD